MNTHNTSIVILVAVVAMAFPILYQAQAHESASEVYSYRVSDVVKEVAETEDLELLVSSRKSPWDLKREVETVLAEPEINVVEKPAVETVQKKSVQASPQTVVSVSTPVPIQKTVVSEPVAPPAKVAATDTRYEEAVLLELQRLTDRQRIREDLLPLKNSSKLKKIALKHSIDMFTEDYFAHTAPDGCTLTCRFKAATYSASTWGENIAFIEGDNMPSAKKVAQSFFEQWMESEGHKDNILSVEYTHQGIGVTAQADAVYVTVNFSKPL